MQSVAGAMLELGEAHSPLRNRISEVLLSLKRTLNVHSLLVRSSVLICEVVPLVCALYVVDPLAATGEAADPMRNTPGAVVIELVPTFTVALNPPLKFAAIKPELVPASKSSRNQNVVKSVGSKEEPPLPPPVF